MLIPHLVRRESLGMGDVKLALLLGAALGWRVMPALALAFICVFPVALVMIARGGLAARTAIIPFAPFMSLGALILLLAPYLTS